MLFIGALVLFRGRSFFSPVSDPTVGLYLHVARTWLHGSLPYVTAWDYRPPGFFALYAAASALVGGRYANVTLGLASLIASTVAVGRIAVLADPRGSRGTGRLASAFFVLLSPVDDGVAGVAELPITAFVAWSIALTLRSASMRMTGIGGLLAGCAVQCKLSAVPLVLVPALLAGSGGSLAPIATFCACAMLPALATVVLYASAGRLRLLDDAIVGATLRRAATLASHDEFRRNYSWAPRQLLELCPQIELAVFALSSSTNRARFATIGWFVAGAASIVLAGEYYERQFFVLVAPASVLGALGFQSVSRRSSPKRVRYALAVVLAVTFALHDYFESNQTLQYATHRVILRDATWRLDQADELVVALERQPQPLCSLYLIEQSPYVYDELGIASPTKYAYSDHLLDPRLARMAGVNGNAELDRIFARAPRYVVVSSLRDYRYDPTSVARVRARLASHYRLTVVDPRFRIYRSETSAPCAETNRPRTNPTVRPPSSR